MLGFADHMLFEETITQDDIESKVSPLGFGTLRWDTKKTLSIITDLNRVDVLDKVEKALSMYGAKYGPWGASSIGSVKLPGFTVLARPANRQGRKSAGLDNEDTLVNNIKEFTKYHPVTIRFTDGSKTVVYENVFKVDGEGYNTKGRKKADVMLFTKDGRKIPISLKKANAEMWESVDTYWGAQAMKVINREIKKGTVTLNPSPERAGAFRLEPTSIAVKASKQEAKDIVFGSDILKGKGIVIMSTFRASDFKLSENGDVLTITVTKIVEKLRDLAGPYDIYFLIRNNLSRNARKMKPGLRAVAVQKSRISKQTVVVSNV